jgi:predicted AlkP superfamily pyrophosphatase or phosphodiesterase
VRRRRAILAAALGLAVTATATSPQPPGVRLAPLVLVVGLDGFRADYLDRAEVPALRALAGRGVRADGLIPPFPSKTYPGFTTLVTGRRPVNHGIVANTMDDPAVPFRFRLGDLEGRVDPRWWLAEPVWNTAERQGVRAASLFWPGDDAAIGGRRPTAWRRYDESVPDDARVAQVLEWLARPPPDRPGLALVYFGLVDAAAHAHGPFSPEALAAASRADALVGALVAGLRRLGLEETAHVLVVSDHGMAETRPERAIALDTLIDPASVDVLETGPILRIAPRRGAGGGDSAAERAETARLLAALRGGHPRLQVYARDGLPERFHYRGSPRIPPIVGVADDGWQVLTRQDVADWRAAGGGARGEHGYDPALPSMHAVLVGAGPLLQRGRRLAPFESVHVYALLCRLLGIVPATHDGDPAVTAGLLTAPAGVR